jgi:hypothetical protein
LRNFEFNLMELLQRTDAALPIEQRRASPNQLLLALLTLRRRRLAARLRRSILQPILAGA